MEVFYLESSILFAARQILELQDIPLWNEMILLSSEFVHRAVPLVASLITVDMGEELGIIHLDKVALMCVFLTLLTIAAFFTRNHYRTKRYNALLVQQLEHRTQKIIREQNELKQQHAIAEEKSRQIMSSLTYAQNIQSAVLQDESCLRRFFPNSFALLESKELVSGDFYWITEKYDTIYLAVVDCTGHGVPGAFMSLIARSLLQEVVQSRGVITPNNILSEMRKSIVDTFNGGSAVTASDGLDLTLFSYNKHSQVLCYSGANQSLFVVRKGDQLLESMRGMPYCPMLTEDSTQLYELKADRQPVGIHYGPIQPFTNQTAKLQKGDRLFAFTDGFRDQFGGTKNKKLKAHRFRNLILSTQHLDMKQQRSALLQSFNTWKGIRDQNDDMCLVGVEL